MTKALFFDIDGTLVSFATHKIPDSTVDAIKAAHNAGHKIFIATGRPPMIINNLGVLEQEGLIDGYITMNGAYCYIKGKVLYSSSIAADEVKAMSKICADNGYPIIYVHEHDMMVCRPDDEVRYVFNEYLHVSHIDEADESHATEGRVYQMTAFFDADFEKKITHKLPGCEFGRWYPTFVDVTAKGNTKAHGIDVILQYFGMTLDDAIAFGDGGNDVPMLRHAGIGVAMGNASDSVKAQADRVTTSVDNNGIYNALSSLGLIGQ